MSNIDKIFLYFKIESIRSVISGILEHDNPDVDVLRCYFEELKELRRQRHESTMRGTE